MHEKSFTQGYKYMKIQYTEDGSTVCRMDWKDLVALLLSPVIDVMKITA